jgi:hypothetical protein
MHNSLEFGIAMSGCAPALIGCMSPMIDPEKHFVYAEIGIAEARTLVAVASIIETMTPNFTCHGIDIESGWSLNMDEVRQRTEPFGDKIKIHLNGSTDFLNSSPDHSIDFLLIDGCHEKDCAAKDFEDACTRIKSGGYVAFHDTADFMQGVQPQPHNNQPCNVLAALESVGLLHDHRPGWKLHWEVKGVEGGENNGMMIFKKNGD